MVPLLVCDFSNSSCLWLGRKCVCRRLYFTSWGVSSELGSFGGFLQADGELSLLFPCGWVGCGRHILGLLNSEKGLQAKPLTSQACTLPAGISVSAFISGCLTLDPMWNNSSSLEMGSRTEGLPACSSGWQESKIRVPSPAPSRAGLQPCFWTSDRA